MTTSLPASLRPTLAGADYIDEAVFAREQDLIFERMWFCAVRTSDLPATGAFRTVQIGRESVLITRTADGSVRALLNVCSHRGARLCVEPAGEVKRFLRCPYHAWTYDLDGTLVAAPNLVKMPDIDRRRFGLTSVHVRQWLGYVWVCLADKPPAFSDDLN